MQAIALAGLLCGAFDISAAFLVYGARYGLKPLVILQSISAALLGKGSYRGGMQTALLGLALHFLVAFLLGGDLLRAQPPLPHPHAASVRVRRALRGLRLLLHAAGRASALAHRLSVQRR